MQLKRHFSLKFVFLMPLVLSAIVLALTIKNYVDLVNREISDEYGRIQNDLSRAAKLVTAIDYSFTNYSKSQYIFLLEHNRQIKNSVCQMWPIDALLLTDGRNHDMPAVDINYMLVGTTELCDSDSDVYQRVASQVSLAPVLSFVHDIDETILGVQYIDREGYLMSSPDTYAKQATAELLDTIKARPFWQSTAQNPDVISISGPAPIAATSDLVMSLTMPVYSLGEHQGMLSLDIAYDELMDTRGKLSGKLEIINATTASFPDNATRVDQFNLEGVRGDHHLIYRLDPIKEIGYFVSSHRYSLLVIGFIYVFSVIVLFLINTRVEHGYLKDLAAKDAMTGLLNRRGLQDFLVNAQHGEYVAIAVFDIDNFKSINDTYGHDVGDNVICYMADQITYSVRASDAVARFGGEEFVVYMSGSNRDALKKSLLRVQQSIRARSQEVVAPGFTVSGGVEIVDEAQASNFEALFKAADEKLYQAKTSGKDKLVF
ncbi:sensor domain-containing diguanylate cyclase [Vibrio sinaloensis]|uniref:sensor domain-containing diguanylate cyclase n=1 Tax=Photobacterium sp. (strain ATCC 43367) TaxID=379097 RepID=UPI00057CBCF8|nr:sensor domain-containing diguanylate cyclase [Vibrio sinaloensis]KHT45822.1 diguanylate cyclase [Vibrio sinaloensis]